MTSARVCRVVVDVLAVERAFDYLVPEALGPSVSVGTIVRVGLAGRRVRAWVVADEVDSEAPPGRLRPLLEVVSAGPPAEVVDLTAWVAWRFAGPRLPVLRSASPPAVIPPGTAVAGAASPPVGSRRGPDPQVAGLAGEAGREPVSVLRWPPTADAAPMVGALLPGSGSAVVIDSDPRSAARLSRRLEDSGWRVVRWSAEGRPTERARVWDRARRGGCVVVGGRAGVLAPVPDLAAVVIIDDGAETLKEERSPTWHARDVAMERARRVGAGVVLISPAPPPEATRTGRVIVPSRSLERSGWPVVEVVDRRREPPGLGLFSPRLVDALRSAAGVGAVCVLNRRGRARLLACSGCAELARCERCRAAVSEADDGSLTCEACGAARPRVCDACGGTRMRILRAGVTRVGEELAALLPGTPVATVDARTETLPEAPVIIGTEAVLHRAGEVGLVAFLDFDSELLAPRFRAGEQALWLLIRAARLVGPRQAGPGRPGIHRRVLVQTRLPRHEVLDAAVRGDPGVLAEAEAPRRRLLDLPPHTVLAQVTGDAAALAVAMGELALAGVEVSSGAGGLLVRAADHRRLCDGLARAMAAARATGRVRAEVDPLRV